MNRVRDRFNQEIEEVLNDAIKKHVSIPVCYDVTMFINLA